MYTRNIIAQININISNNYNYKYYLPIYIQMHTEPVSLSSSIGLLSNHLARAIA